MEKPEEEDASSLDRNKKRRITRSMSKSCTDLQPAVSDHNNQVTGKWMPYIPEDILIKIFLLLSGKVLHDVMAVVCRSWREIIRGPFFTKTHLLYNALNYNSILSVVKFHDKFEVYSLNKEGNTWKFSTRIKLTYLTQGYGLILAADCSSNSKMYLCNPITYEVLKLPPKRVKFTKNMWAVGYSGSTSEYKVFCFLYSSRRAYILTVGADKKWREILVEGDIARLFVANSYYFRSQGSYGFIYWFDSYGKYVIVLDLEKEMFRGVRFPIGSVRDGILGAVRVVSSDTVLCIAVKEKDNCWHFWELRHYKNGSAWRKRGSFNFESEGRKIYDEGGIDQFSPRFFMTMDEVVFTCCYTYISHACNFKSGTVSRLLIAQTAIRLRVLCLRIIWSYFN